MRKNRSNRNDKNKPQYIQEYIKKVNKNTDDNKVYVELMTWYFKNRKCKGSFKQLYTDNSNEPFYEVRKHFSKIYFVGDKENGFKIYTLSNGDFNEIKVGLNRTQGAFKSEFAREFVNIMWDGKPKTLYTYIITCITYGTEEQIALSALRNLMMLEKNALDGLNCHHKKFFVHAPKGLNETETKNFLKEHRVENCDPCNLVFYSEATHKLYHEGIRPMPKDREESEEFIQYVNSLVDRMTVRPMDKPISVKKPKEERNI